MWFSRLFYYSVMKDFYRKNKKLVKCYENDANMFLHTEFSKAKGF